MADNRLLESGMSMPGCFKEAVCVDAGRVYDSCSDKDCLEDLRVYFPESGQNAIDNAISVRSRRVEVITVLMDIEPVPFNRGFYSVDMTFFFEVTCEVCCSPMSKPTTVCGLAIFQKKVILFGSEGNVKIFSSEFVDGCGDRQNKPSKNLPKAVCQIAEPIFLSCRLAEERECCCVHNAAVPDSVCCRFDGNLVMDGARKVCLCTLGVFTIVQLERAVQMLIPVFDFCMPSKECVASGDNPCELFRKISFPVKEFFPPRAEDLNCEEAKKCKTDKRCGCNS